MNGPGELGLMRRCVSSCSATILALCLAVSLLTEVADRSSAMEARIHVGQARPFQFGIPNCGRLEFPDAAARAVRNGDSILFLFGERSLSYQTIDASGAVHKTCAVLFASRERPEYDSFQNAEWVAAVYRYRGKMFGIVHNEFHGHLLSDRCPTKRYFDCWWNSLTLARSRVKDNGEIEFYSVGRSELIASAGSPYRPAEAGLRPTGYFSPTNVFRVGSQYRFAILARLAGDQKPRWCYMFSDAPDHGSAWKYFGPNREELPAAEFSADPARKCTPIAWGRGMETVTGIYQVQGSPAYVAVGLGRGRDRSGNVRTGIIAAFSVDLERWTESQLLVAGERFYGVKCDTWNDNDILAYPAILDLNSADGDFATVGRNASLIWVRFTGKRCEDQTVRAAWIAPIEIQLCLSPVEECKN